MVRGHGRRRLSVPRGRGRRREAAERERGRQREARTAAEDRRLEAEPWTGLEAGGGLRTADGGAGARTATGRAGERTAAGREIPRMVDRGPLERERGRRVPGGSKLQKAGSSLVGRLVQYDIF